VLLARFAHSSLRSQLASLASLDEDENTRDEPREMATDGYIHYKLTCSCSIKNAPCLARRRDAAYGIVMTVARCAPAYFQSELSTTSLSTAGLLFECARNESEELKARACASLDALLGSYLSSLDSSANSTSFPTSAITSLLPLLWRAASSKVSEQASGNGYNTNTTKLHYSTQFASHLLRSAQNSQNSARLAAAKWASSLVLRVEPTEAAHLLCVLSGDGDSSASAMANRAMEEGASEKVSLEGIVRQIFLTESRVSKPTFKDFNVKAKQHAIR